MYAIRSYYEVGNVTRVLVSDLSGRSNILAKAEEFNINLDSKDPVTLEILEDLKEMENRITSYNVCYTKLLRG